MASGVCPNCGHPILADELTLRRLAEAEARMDRVEQGVEANRIALVGTSGSAAPCAGGGGARRCLVKSGVGRSMSSRRFFVAGQ